MRLTASLCTLLAALWTAAAQAQSAPDGLSLELNRIDQIEGACRLTFLAENGLGADVEALTLETVLIDREGVVERLTLFEFGALPDGVPRVRQFDVAGLSCEALGRVLVNGVSDCVGPASCGEALGLTSRVDVELLG
ncbi:hypothetical protein [Roseicyclus sp.]|uniref:hypothetical protein n=1 Tax=Roseicyclus sp. TaxID=1914329 RepID=UPI003F9F6B64